MLRRRFPASILHANCLADWRIAYNLEANCVLPGEGRAAAAAFPDQVVAAAGGGWSGSRTWQCSDPGRRQPQNSLKHSTLKMVKANWVSGIMLVNTC